jgi:hypothetical protein
MASEYWSRACSDAYEAESSDETKHVLYGTHGFAIACFACSTAFSCYWLHRWLLVRRSNPQLLDPAWRYLGVFLATCVTSGIFGVAAWISKINNVYYSVAMTSSQANVTCQHFFELFTQSNQSQSAYRIAYSFEFGALFIAILLSLDRISEHAHGTKNLSRQSQQHASETTFQPGSAGPSPRSDERLIPISSSGTAAPGKAKSAANSKRHRLWLLQLMFRAGLVFVALCCVSSLASVVTAASLQARFSAGFEDAARACDPSGRFTPLSIQLSDDVQNMNQDPLLRSIFAGHISEFIAATMVILLYVATCSLGVSIIAKARRTIEASLAKLEQVQRKITSHLEAKAVSAGRVPIFSCCRVM